MSKVNFKNDCNKVILPEKTNPNWLLLANICFTDCQTPKYQYQYYYNVQSMLFGQKLKCFIGQVQVAFPFVLFEYAKYS